MLESKKILIKTLLAKTTQGAGKDLKRSKGLDDLAITMTKEWEARENGLAETNENKNGNAESHGFSE